MRLSKLGYYSDYLAYPVVIGALVTAGLETGSRAQLEEWPLAVVCGLVVWSLMEYVLHRSVLHGRNYFSPMHGVHHSEPLALVGTPTWMSVGVLTLGIFAPGCWLIGLPLAAGLTTGVMLGYVWYGLVHHVIHHWHPRPEQTYFKAVRARHLRHHHSPNGGNFGVTTALWDHVFGTVIRLAHAKAA
jgi:sterol desaturase/sphingolipid hydroxylase (fatty acid hydroxylase superfamily)